MAATTLALNLPREAIAAFCDAHAIRNLSIFGSAARNDLRVGSDVDVLVEFEPGATPGLAFFELADELEAILGWPVDLVTRASLRGPIGERILKTAVPVYERR